MKYCPTCKDTFEGRNFCGADGTRLVDMPDAEPQNSSNDNRISSESTAVSSAENFGATAANAGAAAAAAPPVAASPPFPASPPVPPAPPATVAPATKKRSWLGNFFEGLTAQAPEISFEIVDPKNAYQPGETFKARVSVKSADAVSVNEVFAGLQTHEQCHEIVNERFDDDDRETTVWKSNYTWLDKKKLIGAGELPAGFAQTFDLEFQIPAYARADYRGSIVKVHNFFKAGIDRPAAKDAGSEKALFIVSKPSAEAGAITEYLRVSAPDSQVQMLLWIPKNGFSEGETVSGKAIIEPFTDAKVRSIAVNLRRFETASGGHRTNSAGWVAQTTALAGETRISPGKRLEFDFEFIVPKASAPTFSANISASKAFVEINLDIPWGRDYTGSKEIFIDTFS